MKKLLMSVLILLTIGGYGSATKFKILDAELYESRDIIKIVKDVVPSDCVDVFLEYTLTDDQYLTDTLRIYLLGVGKKESEWKYTRSFRKNSNGSYDLGYLMINEYNLKYDIFMNAYAPPRGNYTKDQYYLAICINFYKYLYKRYGCDASYAYNAGEGRYLKNKIPSSTYQYKNDISNNINGYITRLYEVKRMRDEEISSLKDNVSSSSLINTLILYVKQRNVTKITLPFSYVILPHTLLDVIVPDNKKRILEKLKGIKFSINVEGEFITMDEYKRSIPQVLKTIGLM